MTNQIEPQALSKLIDEGMVKIVDGSWALDGTDMRALYLKDHIPGAVFFDIEAVSDHSTGLPHTAPSPEAFAAAVGAMGISAEDHVVVYDRQGLFSAARVWWTFKLMGHDKVQVLRGGLPAWQILHLPVTAEVPTPVATTYASQPQPEIMIGLNELRSTLEDDKNPVVLDARSKARFDGTASEPRAGLRSGHMPGARSLPFSELIRDGALKPREELEAIFCNLGIADGHTVVTTCGSGVTAAIITLALEEVGHKSSKLYDGSWAEWGQETLNTPVVT
ncbi:MULTISPECIES: 3-mercaptopyruvate sulfurtransferase [Asticcacaulis]|uniref:3-mercaptopyruvate sulfurtransferase n=1 Tax=Asticcacaulis TaxID=76890 RepID=UPI001AEA0563|nr:MULTISPECIES: 3-mercaptopyruvate sulfurtransferase [Asticcacaulis]MBP2158256.1 thiosulfate/3-mercaptopyruvate sulfurtransferase [Asticcacaulis solisilvae]MDR6799301.1 thiosulfate/3-mercaptopyruvate sulfurtransferase [Asticcacaulis sp. BE141]